MVPKEIFIVEDNTTMRMAMKETLQRNGYLITDYGNPLKAIEAFQQRKVPLIISDLRMDEMTGIDLLKAVKEKSPTSEVILVSAYGTVDTAVEAMHLGASDFITKPFSNDELRIRVSKVFEKLNKNAEIEKLQLENDYLSEELSRNYPEIIGASESMQNVFHMIERVAVGDSTVLIEGESGTGKELVARAIHKRSERSSNPFVRVNCGALNDNLLESELFGHEKGAFTGALKQRKGRFELADGGTLFLDEIGDISTTMQLKLLRVLQEKEFERVGGEETIKTEVRIISATNKNLAQLSKQNKFREDLYYRLCVIPINLPALRERKEDMPLLIEHFLKKLNQSDREIHITKQAMQALCNHNWPGNIRELENFIERLLVIASEEEISLKTVTRYLGSNNQFAHGLKEINLVDALFQYEKNMIVEAMERANGIKNRAAKLLGVKTSALYYKLEKFGLL